MSSDDHVPPTATHRTVRALVDAGLVGRSDEAALTPVVNRYAVALTPAMAALIKPSDADDPIRRQFVPDPRELMTHPRERLDPIGDNRHETVPGVIHRYPDRVLFKLTHACPVYCRFCFRREVVGPGAEPGLAGAALDRALAYVADNPNIFEVILTGGDPLILSPRRIREVTAGLDAIPHVAVVRWHTRVPLVDPARITPDLIGALTSTEKAVFIGVHANHPREFTSDGRAAIRRLAEAGLSLVSQTVLLKGINDDAATLEALMRTFLANRVKPYYLHHMDPAPGTAHHRTTIAEGQALMRALRGRLSGLAQPTYVLDITGGVAKVPIGPSYLTDDTVVAPDGNAHPHPDRG
jgi:lysine 2,3-aminomutase